MEPTLHMAANGHVMLDFNNMPEEDWQRVVKKLTDKWGFIRAGKVVLGASEMIHQDFVRGEIKLLCGWDNWSRNYLLSESRAGDEILRKLFAELAG